MSWSRVSESPGRTDVAGHGKVVTDEALQGRVRGRHPRDEPNHHDLVIEHFRHQRNLRSEGNIRSDQIRSDYNRLD